MWKETLASLMIAGTMLNVSAGTIPLAPQEPPKSEFICISVQDHMITREDIAARVEAERAEAERIAAEKAEAERAAKMAEGKIRTFLITGYCACAQCCGKSDGITATGTVATEGRTIAADPRVLPYGTHVRIGGHEYVVEDCGGAVKGNHIDIYYADHAAANSVDPYYTEVEILY